MGNPEKGPGKLGHEGRGNEQPNLKPSPADVAKKLGQSAIKGSQGKK